MLARLLSGSSKPQANLDLFYDDDSEQEYEERVSAEVLTYASHFGIDLTHPGCKFVDFAQ